MLLSSYSFLSTSILFFTLFLLVFSSTPFCSYPPSQSFSYIMCVLLGLEKVVMSPLVLENYDIAPEYMEILNTGYTATLTFKPFK